MAPKEFKNLRVIDASHIARAQANEHGMYLKNVLALEYGERDTNHYVKVTIEVNGNMKEFDVAELDLNRLFNITLSA